MCCTGRNFISPRESEDTAEAKAGGMFANGSRRVRFADDHEEARCPMCGDDNMWNSSAGNRIHDNNTPQPVAPFPLMVPPAPIPLQHSIPGYPPYYYAVNNTGVLYGAAAAAPQAPIPLQHPIPVYRLHYYVANNTGVGNHLEEGEKKKETGRYYAWEEGSDSKGRRFWRHYSTGKIIREDPYV